MKYNVEINVNEGGNAYDQLYPKTNANITQYDNSTSGLSATNVQDAIDELITQDVFADFVGATSSADGKSGAVSTPLIADREKFLRGNGEWSTPELNLSREKRTLTAKEDINKYRLVYICSDNTAYNASSIRKDNVTFLGYVDKDVEADEEYAFDVICRI